jgi:hypothetical protein
VSRIEGGYSRLNTSIIVVDNTRSLVIHAGTHKTASTYIQNRLASNREILGGNNIFLVSPDTRKVGRCFELATHIKSGKFLRVKKLLQSIPDGVDGAILSDERLTQALIQEGRMESFIRVAKRAGFRIKLVFFIRDQPDYINSLYVQEVKRFCHSMPIEKYVSRCLLKRASRFDYFEMFRGIIKCRSVDVQFLPFGSAWGDPFERLMHGQGWYPSDGWHPADAETLNDQIGAKGVWLARKVGRRLVSLGVERRLIRGQSRFIGRYAKQNGWSESRYYGLDEDMVQNIRDHYSTNNERFAQLVWNQPWQTIFPPAKRVMNVFDLSDVAQRRLRQEFRALVDQVVSEVLQDKPDAFSSN